MADSPKIVDPWTRSGWDGHFFEEGEEACATCKFWQRHEEKDEGECHRHAPQATRTFDETFLEAIIEHVGLTYEHVRLGDTDALLDVTEARRDAHWPETKNWDWCGEWKPGTRKRQMPR